MAYDKEKLYKQCLKQVVKKNVFFIEHLIAYIAPDKTTFYRLFPPNSNEYNTIKELMEDNIIKTKNGLHAKCFNSDSPTAWFGLYKLIGSDEERRKLSQSFQDHTSGGDKITGFIYADPNDKTDEETT